MSTVTEYLVDQKVPFITFDHARTETAAQEAIVLAVAPGEVAKTIVLDTPRGHVLAVIPASRRLDVDLAAHALALEHVTLATEAEIARDFPGYQLGAVPPIAGLVSCPVYVDQDLARHDSVVFASGSQTQSIKLAMADLTAHPLVAVVPLAAAPRAIDEDWME